MIKINKITKIAFAAVLAGVISVPITSFASNDDIDFSFKIYSYHQNGKEADGRYRQTEDINNPWKVRLDNSGEGKGTITRFWLENSSAHNVSVSKDVKQGNGPYYTNPDTGANKRTVWLTAENNNFNGSSYTVSGIWDEETW